MGENVGICHGLHSYNQDLVIRNFALHGRVAQLVETHGFDDIGKADVNILNNIAFWLSRAHRAKPEFMLSGMIYLHFMSEARMCGSAVKNLEMMKLHCGAGFLQSW